MKGTKSKKSEKNLKVTEEQAAIGVSVIDGQRCLHGLNMDQVDEMNELGLGLEDYKKTLKPKKGK